ncbi:MAG: hypothetical protein EPN60_12265 [Nevskiaceae bacterium]|nr:MAG: hypothetical protein EPN60_12265 [Nevskiaceae bacterium]
MFQFKWLVRQNNRHAGQKNHCQGDQHNNMQANRDAFHERRRLSESEKREPSINILHSVPF